MKRPLFLLLALLVFVPGHRGVGETAPAEGLREFAPSHYALVGARLVVAPGQVLEKGTVVVRDGRIVAVGKEVEIPAGITQYDLEGKTIYPGFIDAYTQSSAEGSVAGPGYWNSN